MNQQILSQDEVDALLQGITGESQKLEQEEAPTEGVREYNLAQQERIVRGRMPTMEIVNERFARNIRIGLFNFIRKSPEVSVGSIKVQKYSAFLREIVVPTNFNIMAVRPLRGSGLIVCEPTLVFSVIDALFGGVGKFHTRIEGRDFSATEQRIIRRLVDVITEEYKKSWQGIYPIELDYQRSEMQPQFATVATPSEIVVCCSFTLEIGDSTGTIHFCIPYATFEPIRDILFSSIQGDSVEPDRRWVKLLTQQIQSAEVDLVAELGHAPATVEQLLALKPGDFIELDLEKIIQAKVDGVPVFDCYYGTSNGKYALRVNKLVSSSTAGWIGEQNG
ncbi:MAG: flagellar motor switch protein FliM [Aquabacterium sp.]|jgi:flagellar motor switch protein FliM|uniref:flagellar motor switch protein FliM n=1 Tax=Aquabacterium sp. TaxID=1872578 RepID=UPI001B60AEB5|nr:flagellar motor switch protein FliM [Aquabacterium sp.]MBP7132117.1 flagellar motor switch protein FliM [Aquabacterium sp.]MBP9062430.1 flagellar motor switch protein FliM [Aquabacterium sp.]